jgi:hypothetical protein
LEIHEIVVVGSILVNVNNLRAVFKLQGWVESDHIFEIFDGMVPVHEIAKALAEMRDSGEITHRIEIYTLDGRCIGRVQSLVEVPDTIQGMPTIPSQLKFFYISMT